MRVRVGRAHLAATVLEDLDPGVVPAQLLRLIGPQVDDTPNRALVELSEGQIVSRTEAQDPARAPFTFRHEEPVGQLIRAAVRV